MNIGVSSLGDFGSWWITQMITTLRLVSTRLLPLTLRNRLGGMTARWTVAHIIIDTDTRTVTLQPRTRQDAPRVSEASAHGIGVLAAALRPRLRLRRGRTVPVHIVLPGIPMLQRHLRVPVAARGEAASLVGYEIDRITPFTQHDVLWSVTPVASTRHDGDAEFRLDLTPREPVAPWLEMFREHGLRPISIASVAGPTAATITLDTLPPAITRRRGLLLGLVASCAIALPFMVQSIETRHVEAQLDGLQLQRHLAEQLRTRLDALTSGSALIDQEARKIGAPIDILAALTQALPDDTFLDNLTLKGGTLTIEGQSANAALLIGRLEQTGIIRDPSFAGPVLHLPDARGESFSLHAATGSGKSGKPRG